MFNGHQLQLILASLMNGDLCAMDIVDKVKKDTGTKLSDTGIYAQMQRLHNEGLVKGYYEQEAPDGGRPRRLYHITALGRRAVDDVVTLAGYYHA